MKTLGKTYFKNLLLERIKEHQKSILISRKYISSIDENEKKIRIKELREILKTI